MKKYKSLLQVFILVVGVGSFLVIGCSSQNSNEKLSNVIDVAMEKTQNEGDSAGGDGSSNKKKKEETVSEETTAEGIKDKENEQFRGKNEGVEGNITYTSLTIEKDDLFSNRDLDSAPDTSGAVNIEAKDNSEYTITSEGIYILSGVASNFTVKVETEKNAKVQILLSDTNIVNDDFPIIYVKSADKCFVTLLGENKLSVSNEFISDGDIKTDAAIFSRSDLTLNGNGSLNVESKYGNGITTKDDLRITGGKYSIYCALDGIEANDTVAIYNGEFVIDTKKDAIHCENDNQEGSIYIKAGTYRLTAGSDGIQATSYLVIDDGEFNIISSEGFEATYVQINDGMIDICASDDGINASRKSSEYDVVIEINGGDIKISMEEGDTDGIDANGIIVVNGGNVDVNGKSAFDYDKGAIYNGGTIVVNGVVVNEIPESMMGGPGGFGEQRDKENFGFSNGRERFDLPDDLPTDQEDFGGPREPRNKNDRGLKKSQ